MHFYNKIDNNQREKCLLPIIFTPGVKNFLPIIPEYYEKFIFIATYTLETAVEIHLSHSVFQKGWSGVKFVREELASQPFPKTFKRSPELSEIMRTDSGSFLDKRVLESVKYLFGLNKYCKQRHLIRQTKNMFMFLPKMHLSITWD